MGLGPVMEGGVRGAVVVAVVELLVPETVGKGEGRGVGPACPEVTAAIRTQGAARGGRKKGSEEKKS